MITLLLGPDDFSKKEYIKNLTLKDKLEVEYFVEEDQIPSVTRLTEQSLFLKAKVFVFEGLLNSFDEANLHKLIDTHNHIVFVEESLDKRTTLAKELTKNKKINIKEFNLPHGKEFTDWIINRVKDQKGSISSKAAEILALYLGKDETVETKFGGKVVFRKEIFNLWQADSEIKKLIALAAGKEITEKEIEQLVPINKETDTLKIVNAMAEKQKQEVFNLYQQFFKDSDASGEKGKIIQLLALMAEQFRNVLMVQDFLEQHLNDDQILKLTGWKSGRLFIIKKIANKFEKKNLLDFLTKLEHFDLELKTSSTPPKVLLDLITAQLLV